MKRQPLLVILCLLPEEGRRAKGPVDCGKRENEVDEGKYKSKKLPWLTYISKCSDLNAL